MWVFYMFSLPLTIGMVILTLRYFAGPDVPKYVFFTVAYTWFCSLSIIVLVPADIWTTINGDHSGVISFLWSLSYWSTFCLTWAVVPIIQGYEDAGDITVKARLKTSIHGNLVFYLSIGVVALFGLILLIALHNDWTSSILGVAMALSNTFGLVTGAFPLGFGLSEIPKGIWTNADWTTRQKVLSHKVAKMAVKLDDAHKNFSNAIVITQATSKQMSKRDPLRPYMNIIDEALLQMLKGGPTFKPQGGRLGENDMDYDTDEKSMASLRRHLKRAHEKYYRYRSEYTNFVVEALELEDTLKNNERRKTTGWKYISSFRPERTGRLGSTLDTIEFLWRCKLRKQLEKSFAVTLGLMKTRSACTVSCFHPMMYMCVCTYYSLFKMGMLMFYSLTLRQTSSVSLLMICSMVARYSPPMSYNFLSLIHLDGNAKTIFEKKMGNIDDAVPFFGDGFNKIYPLIMVIYTLIIASNFFNRLINYFGNWRIFKTNDDIEDVDGVNPSGLIILQKERSLLQRGHKVGEHVFPLARFGMSYDVESTVTNPDKNASESSATKMMQDSNEGQLPLSKGPQIEMSKNLGSRKYIALKEDLNEHSLENDNESVIAPAPSSGLGSKWESMKKGFKNFMSNFSSGKFLPLNAQGTTLDLQYSSESLDEMFERLKNPPSQCRDYGDL